MEFEDRHFQSLEYQAYITETQEAYPHFWNERIKNVENNIMLLLIPKGDIC